MINTVSDMNPDSLRVISIIDGTSVDGPGLRTSIYLAGCSHHCPECHNPGTWSADAGTDMAYADLLSRIDENDFDVTFSGGDPLFQAERLLPLLRAVHESGRNVWLYTGYTFEQVLSSPRLSAVLPYIDVMVDGRFEIAKRDVSLHFRGSSNQRLVDVRQSLAEGRAVEYQY